MTITIDNPEDDSIEIITKDRYEIPNEDEYQKLMRKYCAKSLLPTSYVFWNPLPKSLLPQEHDIILVVEDDYLPRMVNTILVPNELDTIDWKMGVTTINDHVFLGFQLISDLTHDKKFWYVQLSCPSQLEHNSRHRKFIQRFNDAVMSKPDNDKSATVLVIGLKLYATLINLLRQEYEKQQGGSFSSSSKNNNKNNRLNIDMQSFYTKWFAAVDNNPQYINHVIPCTAPFHPLCSIDYMYNKLVKQQVTPLDMLRAKSLLLPTKSEYCYYCKMYSPYEGGCFDCYSKKKT